MTGVAAGADARTRSAASLAFLACPDRAVEPGRPVDVAPLLYGVPLAEAAAVASLPHPTPSAGTTR